MKIRVEHPLSPSSRDMISASQSALLEVFEPDAVFSSNPEELDTPNTMFFVARSKGQPLGCVALVDEGRYAEIKRLYVLPEARGLGVARALMAELEQTAKDLGLPWIRLETGEKLEAAVALYRDLGFTTCGKFGTYSDHPESLFLEKKIALSLTAHLHS